jgi:hypothetical protein
VVLEYSGFAAYVTNTQMADFLRCPETNIETMIRAFGMVGDADAINYGSFWPYGLCYDYMCIMGDVPASMLFLDTPENVYAYCRQLVRELGPERFILQSGCDIPANAKLENVKAMVAASAGS